MKDNLKAEEWFGKYSFGTYLECRFLQMFLREGKMSNEHIFQVKFLNDAGAQQQIIINYCIWKQGSQWLGIQPAHSGFRRCFEQGPPFMANGL
jgi:hypothetical protein